MAGITSGLSSERSTILMAAIGLAIFLLVTGLFPDIGRTKTPRKLERGRKIPVHLTLVTADAHDLACAGDAAIEGARCAFAKDGSPSGVQGPQLAPYMTTDNVLFLVPELFSEPALAKKLADDPPTVGRDKLRRFVAKCQLTIVDQAKGFYVRWQPNAEWSWRDAAWVGRVSECSID